MSTLSGPLRRASATSKFPGNVAEASYSSSSKSQKFIKLRWPFGLPTTPELGATRIIQNIGQLGYYYTFVVWISLVISLIPCRKESLFLLWIVTDMATHYVLLLKAFPNLNVFCELVQKWVVFGILAVAAAICLILTDAGLHLALTLTIGLPVILVHAVFWVREEGENVSLLAKEDETEFVQLETSTSV